MDRKIREAFGEIRAGEGLKESTLAYLAQKTNGFQGKRSRPLARRLAAAVCSLLVVAGVGLLDELLGLRGQKKIKFPPQGGDDGEDDLDP